MQIQFIEMNGRCAIDPKYISKIRWTRDLMERFNALYKRSGLSLRKIGDAAKVGHSYVDKLRKGGEEGKEFDADYDSVLRVLGAIGARECDLFDCPYISINHIQ
jgi:transcriptional regulator with XRE-family HTH domain